MTHVQKETAILLKEKGFDLPVRKFYGQHNNGELTIGVLYDYNLHEHMVSAPTLYQANDWLRKTKGVHVSAFPSAKAYKWQSKVDVIENGKVKFVDAVNTYFDPCATHDLALEAGIIHALKHYVK